MTGSGRRWRLSRCVLCAGPSTTIPPIAASTRSRTLARVADRGSSVHPAADGARLKTAKPLADFVDALRGGAIGALKGLGGYHLTCDAGNRSVVAELRRRKHRDEKPFGIMVQDIAAVETFCEIGEAERPMLLSPRRPIVLLRNKPTITIADEVAPGNPWLGVMLPYTPLHHLLLQAAGLPLVMTSGNRSDEPVAYRDDDVVAKLAGIADLFHWCGIPPPDPCPL